MNMTNAKRVTAFFSGTWRFEKKLQEPEACYAKPRAATGFFASLTEDQKKKALEYRGRENFGSKEFHKAG